MAIKYLTARWWLLLGRFRSKREDYLAALPCYERVLRLFPSHLRALANVGNCLQHQGRLVEAIAFYHRALEVRPDYPDVHARLALAFLNLQQYQESIDSFNRAFRMKPSLRDEPWYSVPFSNAVRGAELRKDAASVDANGQDALGDQ